MSPWRSSPKAEADYSVGQQAYLERLFGELDPSHHFPLLPGVQVEEWRVDLRDILNALLGLHSIPPTPLAPKVIARVEEDDYTIEHVQFQAERGSGVPAWFFSPNTPRGDGQAVLALHGEGDGVDDPSFPYIREFARRGYYVLAPELRDFGQRRDAGLDPDQSSHIFTLFGRNLFGLQVWECLKCLDYMVSRKEVNPEFIGICGMGIGAQLAMMAGALDERVSCVGLCGYLTSFRDLCFNTHNHVFYVMPNILHYCDLSDVAGLIGPRPMIFEAAEDNSKVDHRETLQAYGQVEKIYQAWGKPDSLALSTFPGELHFEGTQTYAWFSKWLSP